MNRTDAHFPIQHCAIYTRKSTEEGLEQDFNSLHAQREACEAYIQSQYSLGWRLQPQCYDDGGFSGGDVHRPALQQLLDDISLGGIHIVVVYKVDRLTRSLADFAKMVELFDAHGVSFVSVTQQFNTTNSMGRLTLNVLLSFAQFEREVTGERIRDKISASKRKGMWMGGYVPIGYQAHERTLTPDPQYAPIVRSIFDYYIEFGNVRVLQDHVRSQGWRTPLRTTRKGTLYGGKLLSRGHLYRILRNPIYIGKISHKGKIYKGNHPALISQSMFEQVQKLLEANKQGHSQRCRATAPSLLAGKVVHEDGTAFSCDHSNKQTKQGTKRYRYYVCEATQPAIRIPAQELDQLLVQSIAQLLHSEQRIAQVVQTVYKKSSDGTPPIDHILSHCRKLSAHLNTQLHTRRYTKKTMQIVHNHLNQIVVHSHKVCIYLNPSLFNMDACHRDELKELLLIEQHVKLQRSGLKVKLHITKPQTDQPNNQLQNNPIDDALVKLLKQAHEWMQLLLKGEAKSMTQIAKQNNLDLSWVSRVTALGFLAPDLIQLVMQGKQPAHWTVTYLTRQTPLPLCWDEQRQKLMRMP